jgi:hypothetical protein
VAEDDGSPGKPTPSQGITRGNWGRYGALIVCALDKLAGTDMPLNQLGPQPRPAQEPLTRPGQRPVEDPPDSGPVVPPRPDSPPAREPPTQPGTGPMEEPQIGPDTVG